jgi:hypothetical protein
MGTDLKAQRNSLTLYGRTALTTNYLNLNQYTKMNTKIYLGVDCGKSGAVSEIDNAGNLIEFHAMPIVGKGKGSKLDLQKLAEYFSYKKLAIENGRDYMVIVEDPGGHAPSAAGLRSMTYCFAAIETLLVAYKIKHHIVLSQKWQREFWSKPQMPKGQKFDTKAAALAEAKKLWPDEHFRVTSEAGNLLKNPHDGIVDAALLATYGMRKRI